MRLVRDDQFGTLYVLDEPARNPKLPVELREARKRIRQQIRDRFPQQPMSEESGE